jgi:hypothetical protein
MSQAVIANFSPKNFKKQRIFNEIFFSSKHFLQNEKEFQRKIKGKINH